MKLLVAYASDRYIDDPWFGAISLDPEGADLSRFDEDYMRLLLGHQQDKVQGRLYDQVFVPGDPGYYTAIAEIPDVAATAEYRQLLREGVRGLLSVGFKITGLRLVYVGETYADDKYDADWRALEVSDVGSPADLTRVLEILEDNEATGGEEENGD